MMLPHQERVISELNELSARRRKLASFLGSPVFNGLPADEQDRLRRQHGYMAEYEAVLRERIDHFPVAEFRSLDRPPGDWE
jgi:hypothetical protein